MIPDDFIDELLAKTDIVDVIEQYLPLKKGGANYMACCPFHKEKSPSFSVSPSKQFYHCFGCGAHGTAIGFVMEHQGLSFTEAVQLLADRVGMTVPRRLGYGEDNAQQHIERKKQQQSLTASLQTVADFYANHLIRTEQAMKYVQQRGLSVEIVRHYGLGYAPNDWQGLAQIFQPYPNQMLNESGMLVEKEGRFYDRFRHRLMFPIRGLDGQIIGFGGRVLDESKPKYLNSPDTVLFDKGRNLYGLYEARAAIRDTKRVLVVEGYMDVIALAQFGIGYAVAALGTATTAEHIKLLMRQSDAIYFCFDGDAAGKKAAWRALENALPQLKDDKSLHFLFLPENHDPDSYIRVNGAERFEDALLHQSQPLSVYFWQYLTENLTLENQEGRAELVKKATPLLKQIQAPTLSFLLKQELSRLTGIDPANLAYLMGQAAPQREIRSHHYRLPRESYRLPESLSLVQKQIRSLLYHPEWSEFVQLPDYLPVQGEAACLLALARFFKGNQRNIAQALEHFRDTPFAPLISNVLRENYDDVAEENQQMERQAFQEGIERIVLQLKEEQLNHLKQKGNALNTDEKILLLQLLRME